MWLVSILDEGSRFYILSICDINDGIFTDVSGTRLVYFEISSYLWGFVMIVATERLGSILDTIATVFIYLLLYTYRIQLLVIHKYIYIYIH